MSQHFLATIALSLFAVTTVSADETPNIIVIMADDIGAEGLACYGSTIYTTPNLDQMASEGVRFNNAYATPLCTPTRVMIMSGLYPNRTGFRALIGKGEGVRMPASIRTFGHDFRGAGYKTAIAGKWQLGKFDEFPDQPIEHGFDEYCMWTWVYKGKKSSRFYSPQIYQDGKIDDYGADDYGRRTDYLALTDKHAPALKRMRARYDELIADIGPPMKDIGYTQRPARKK